MKIKALLLLSLTVFLTVFARNADAQEYAVVNLREVYEQLPDYQSAQAELKQYAAQWQKEIDDRQAQFDNMAHQYEADLPLLTDSLKKQRERTLHEAEQRVRELQRRRFGPDGDFNNKKKELLQPVTDRVQEVIETMARARNYRFVLDKSEGITVMFNSPQLDKTDDVLQQLGIKKAAPAK
jgi:outer membrane protein